jgi:hypothetical protein
LQHLGQNLDGGAVGVTDGRSGVAEDDLGAIAVRRAEQGDRLAALRLD